MNSSILQTVLIVDPEEPATAVTDATPAGGYRRVIARTGAAAIGRMTTFDPSVAVIVHALPDMPGLALCRHIRARSKLTVIFVIGPDSEENALASYLSGADGYLTLPHRERELDARIRAALRRAPATESYVPTLRVGDVSVDLDRHEVRVRGQAVRMPLREFSLLSLLLTRPGKVWTREALMRRIWGETPASGTKTLDVHVRRIRSRIEDDPSRPTRLLTVQGVGYRYASPAENPVGSPSG